MWVKLTIIYKNHGQFRTANHNKSFIKRAFYQNKQTAKNTLILNNCLETWVLHLSKKNQKHFPKWLALSACINCFVDEEMLNGTRNNGTFSWIVQAYFFLRHSLHNAGNGFIWFLVFLIKSKPLKEKAFLSYFTFFCTFVFHKLYFP